MDDYGAKWTDDKIRELEERIKELYSEAHDEIYAKYMAFCRKFEKDDKLYSQQLKDGKITAATYRDWLRGQVFQRRRWQAQLDDLAKTLTRINQIAMDIINEAAPGVFAMNANWAEFEIEQGGNANMGFGLYDENTVKELLRDEPDLLPRRSVNVDVDERWNAKYITRQIELGITMGEGILQIAKRLQKTTGMCEEWAKTNARTAMTAAQSLGRLEGMRQAEELGIELEKQWSAGKDSHTREAHQLLDGQRKPRDEAFDSLLGPIMYPGDPDANPRNVYRCRCTLKSYNPKYPPQNAKMRDSVWDRAAHMTPDVMESMNYPEWYKYKESIYGKERMRAVVKKARNRSADESQLAEYQKVLGRTLDFTRGIDGFQEMKHMDEETYRFAKLDYRRRNHLILHPEEALPHATSATADSRKFTHYLFGGNNKDGAAKGVAIKHRLGYDIDNWEEFEGEIMKRADKYPVTIKGKDQHGQRYEQKMVIYGLNGTPANVVVGWIEKDGKTKLTSAYIKEVD